MSQTATNLKVTGQVSNDAKTPKLKKNQSSHLAVSKLTRNFNQSSMSSLHSGGLLASQDVGSSSLNRSINPTRSLPNLMSKTTAAMKQK